MITITWHFLIMLLLAIFTFCSAITRSNSTRGMFGSPRAWAILLWSVGWTVAFLIYGGIVWW